MIKWTKERIIWWPFRPHCIRDEYLRADGTWADINAEAA